MCAVFEVRTPVRRSVANLNSLVPNLLPMTTVFASLVILSQWLKVFVILISASASMLEPIYLTGYHGRAWCALFDVEPLLCLISTV